MQLVAKFVSSVTLAATLASAFALPRFVLPRQTAGDYTVTFSNLTGAVQGTDFITFSLVDTTDECTAFCDTVTGCTFANSYHDVNGKDDSPQLTCSLYASCYDATSATNMGGQTQPDGSTNSIADSDGFCKATPTPPPADTTVPTTDPTDPTTTDGTGA